MQNLVKNYFIETNFSSIFTDQTTLFKMTWRSCGMPYHFKVTEGSDIYPDHSVHVSVGSFDFLIMEPYHSIITAVGNNVANEAFMEQSTTSLYCLCSEIWIWVSPHGMFYFWRIWSLAHIKYTLQDITFNYAYHDRIYIYHYIFITYNISCPK